MMRMEPKEVQLLVRLLRASRSWTQDELGAMTGVEGDSIQRFEDGKRKPADATVERMIAAVGLPVDVAMSVLPPVIRLLHILMGPDPAQAQKARPIEWETGLGEEALLGDLKTAAGAALGALAAALAVEGRRGRTAGAGRAADEDELRTLPERLCGASVRAAARNAARAVELARLAVQGAQSAEGSEAWRTRLEGWARAFLANALRVSGLLVEADAEFREVWRLWQEGREGDPEGLLPEWRLLDLEASLRRDQLRTAEALVLLERARGLAPDAARGRLLINTASALELAGDVAGSIRALREAVLLVGEHGDLRDKCCVAFNLAVNLCHLGKFEEARECLDEAREVARGLGNELDGLRMKWLGARVDAGLGRREAARAALVQVRDQLVQGGNAFAAAVVSVEISVMDLEAGRTAEVKEVAEAMAWIFSAEGIERDALAALRLFCEAARQETATVAQAQEVLRRLEQCQPLRRLGRD